MKPQPANASEVPEGDSPYHPRIILCFPGVWQNRQDLEERLTSTAFRLKETGLTEVEGGDAIEVQFVGKQDARMKPAFEASACRVRPSLSPADYRAIETHRAALYVLTGRFGRSTALALGARMLEVGRALLDAGAIAVKCESSGISHSGGRWKEMADRFRKAGKPDSDAAWQVLYEAYVRLPVANESGQIFSRGMHLLGCPDAIVDLQEFPDAHRVLEGFLRTFGKAAESNMLPLQHAFKDEKSGRVVSMLEPCSHYPAEHFFWNRWGCFRLKRAP